MTGKRFVIMDNLPKGTHSNIWDKQKQHNQGIGDELWLGEVVAMLNEGVILAEENEQLRKDSTVLILANQDYRKENEQLKKELSEYKDFVLSDDKILCYTCLFCTHKGIYEVDCDVKGHVDVHGTCHNYTQKELEE